MKKIQQALISVFDKTGLQELVEVLSDHSIKIISSGGTAKYIQQIGHSVSDISIYTGYPEMPGGLVKTLHPKIHGGILVDVDDPSQYEYIVKHSITPIDIIIVNLYPFTEVMKKGNLKNAIQNIDIGGVTLLRAAAKSSLQSGRVTVVSNINQYKCIIQEIKKTGNISTNIKQKLIVDAFQITAEYEQTISKYMNDKLL